MAQPIDWSIDLIKLIEQNHHHHHISYHNGTWWWSSSSLYWYSDIIIIDIIIMAIHSIFNININHYSIQFDRWSASTFFFLYYLKGSIIMIKMIKHCISLFFIWIESFNFEKNLFFLILFYSIIIIIIIVRCRYLVAIQLWISY